MRAPLTSVNFGAAEFIGDYAFANTSLTTVTLPASFNKATYKYTWTIYDEKGRVEQVKSRNIPSFGAGAFSSIKTLTAINVASDGEIVSIDGILYAVRPDGYELLQYPAGKSGKSYKTVDCTVAIGDSAFEGVEELENIEFVYTVGTIGSYAFYSSSVKKLHVQQRRSPDFTCKIRRYDGYELKRYRVLALRSKHDEHHDDRIDDILRKLPRLRRKTYLQRLLQ